MALTNTEVCNLALDYLGKQNITDMSENSNEAVRCARQLPIARRLVLSQTPWTFARRVKALAPEAINPHEGDWQFCYDIPRECLKVFRVIPAGAPVTLRGAPLAIYQEQGKLYCNQPDARLLYVFDNDNPGDWSDGFTDAVAAQLALRLAPGMVRRASDVQVLRDIYAVSIENAIQNDASQEVTNYRWGDGYADARMTHSGGTDLGRQPDGSTIWG